MSSLKENLRFFAVAKNDMTLCPSERKVLLKFYVHLFGHIRRQTVLSSFNCNLFSIIKFFISTMHVSTRNRAMNMLGKNRGFDLNVISKQVDT